MKKPFLVIIYLLCIPLSYCQPDINRESNCFTIIVGKNASVDGSVFVAHNEDDPGELIVDLHKVPRDSFYNKIKINDTTFIKSNNQNSYLWIEVPGQNFADGFMNEFGVTICSNQALSKEKDEVGIIGYFLRKTLAIEARSAREAVKIAGKLIEKYGYSYSGRDYTIADPNEAWIIEIVKGKHWIAKRLPDDEIAIVPNYYTITEVNLLDTANYLGSSDLIDYAIKRDWNNPQNFQNFNFRIAYGNPETINSELNIARKWVCLNYFSKQKYDFNANFPFSFKPKSKVGLKDLMYILKNHYEGTKFETGPGYMKGNPHKNDLMRICSEMNLYSFVIQLRNWLPNDIGYVLWFAPRRPCIQPFIPLYFGITAFPSSFEKESYKNAESDHFKKDQDFKKSFPNQASLVFYDYAEMIDKNYGLKINNIKKYKDSIQKILFNNQTVFEQNVLEVYKKDKEKARSLLTEYSSKYANLILADTKQKLIDYKSKQK